MIRWRKSCVLWLQYSILFRAKALSDMKHAAGLAPLSLLLATAAQASPMTLTLSAEDLTTLQVFTSVFTDAGTPNTITIGSGNTGAVSFTGEEAISTVWDGKHPDHLCAGGRQYVRGPLQTDGIPGGHELRRAG